MFPAHDLKSGKIYTPEEYDEIIEALCLRLLSNAPLQVVVMHKGSDGKRRFGPSRLVNIGLDEKTFTVRDANESVVINCFSYREIPSLVPQHRSQVHPSLLYKV